MATTDSEAAPDWRRYRPLMGAIPALSLVLIALWEVAATVRAGADVPGDGAWQRAAEVVRAEYRVGDLIVFAPRWNDPVGRRFVGDLIPVDVAGRMDAARFGRIWELSVRGARARETAGLEATKTRDVSGIAVRLYEREAAVVLTDFVTSFSRADGRVAGRARVELQEVGFEPHRCVVARPGPGQTVSVRYPAARLGTSFVGYVGLADVFTRRDDREPARLDVAVDGAVVATTAVGVDDGWVRFEAKTPPTASAAIEFRATAVGPKSRRRLICFAAEARE